MQDVVSVAATRTARGSFQGALAVRGGDAEVIITGGQESISLAN